MTKAPEYLGDGVFADCDEYGGVTLTCEEGTSTHEILLTRDALEALREYLRLCQLAQTEHLT